MHPDIYFDIYDIYSYIKKNSMQKHVYSTFVLSFSTCYGFSFWKKNKKGKNKQSVQLQFYKCTVAKKNSKENIFSFGIIYVSWVLFIPKIQCVVCIFFNKGIKMQNNSTLSNLSIHYVSRAKAA